MTSDGANARHPRPGERCSLGNCRTRSWEDRTRRERCYQHGSNEEDVLRVSWAELRTWPAVPRAVLRAVDAWEREAHERQRRAEEAADGR